ncbi:hypothetical protein NGRA_1464 [Nosema granulosis]|uniref:Uncharacterized protein n=1 Tax=Nosema granulosis TaxID=83296 RepID=A0A9P6GZE2_9MICR|nr:hypothetical protein NGRA_1464 [Nosema granulosis]
MLKNREMAAITIAIVLIVGVFLLTTNSNKREKNKNNREVLPPANQNDCEDCNEKDNTQCSIENKNTEIIITNEKIFNNNGEKRDKNVFEGTLNGPVTNVEYAENLNNEANNAKSEEYGNIEIKIDNVFGKDGNTVNISNNEEIFEKIFEALNNVDGSSRCNTSNLNCKNSSLNNITIKISESKEQTLFKDIQTANDTFSSNNPLIDGLSFSITSNNDNYVITLKENMDSKDESESTKTFDFQIKNENNPHSEPKKLIIKVHEDNSESKADRACSVSINQTLNVDNTQNIAENQKPIKYPGIIFHSQKSLDEKNTFNYYKTKSMFKGNLSSYLFERSNPSISFKDLYNPKTRTSEIFLWNYGCFFIVDLLKNNQKFYEAVCESAEKFEHFKKDNLKKLSEFKIPQEFAMGDNHLFSLGQNKKLFKDVDSNIKNMIEENYKKFTEFRLFNGSVWIEKSDKQQKQMVDVIYNSFSYIFNVLIEKSTSESGIQKRYNLIYKK